MTDPGDRLAGEFQRAFKFPAQRVARAPGRVNLIGEHTDYNDGFVLPMAIDRDLLLAFRARSDGRLRLISGAEPQEVTCDGGQDQEAPSGWGAYVCGVALALRDAGFPIVGIDGYVSGNLPAGAGLSSSAALELAVARALMDASGSHWDPPAMARLCQWAEERHAGNRCGIMDQMSVALGGMMLLDCRSLGTTAVQLPPGLSVVICDSGTRRELAGSAYNERRQECEAAARILHVPALRDIEPGALRRGALPEPLLRRARHVVEENARVLAAAQALRTGDGPAMGGLMTESHRSLRDLFEVSTPALDLLVELALGHPGCLGSRMTGAGFGGCTVSLVQTPLAPSFASAVVASYSERSGTAADAYVCHAGAGASVGAC